MTAGVAGKRYPPVVFELDAERVRAFVSVLGHPTDDVPPTIVSGPELAAGLVNVVTDPDLGISLGDVLHGEQEYEWARPLSVGERVVAEATIEDVRAKGGLELIRLRTDLRDEGGRTVAVGRSMLIVRRDA